VTSFNLHGGGCIEEESTNWTYVEKQQVIDENKTSSTARFVVGEIE